MNIASIISSIVDLWKKIFGGSGGGSGGGKREFYCGAFLMGYPEFSLDFLANSWSDDKRQKLLDNHKAYGCNVFKFCTDNLESPNVVDDAWIKRTVTWTNKMISMGLEPIPVLMMDGRNSWTDPRNYDKHVEMMKKFSAAIGNKWKWILTGHEVSKYWKADYCEKFAKACKTAFPGAHIGMQSQEYEMIKRCPSCDWFAVELPGTPLEGDQRYTPVQVWDRSKAIIDSLGGDKKIWIDEVNVNVNGQKAKLQGLAGAAQDTFRCMGVDSGFPDGANFVKFMKDLAPGMTASRSGNIVTMTGNSITVKIDLASGTYVKV